MGNFIFCAMVTVEETLRLIGAQKQPLEVFNKKKAVLKHFTKFTGRLCWSLFEIKMTLQYWCFTVNIAKFSRIPILKNICERLLLDLQRMTLA